MGEIKAKVDTIISKFDLEAAKQVKSIEAITNHDLKSVEYYLKNQLPFYKEYIHFCCTSEDINNLSYALMLRDSLKSTVIPSMNNLLHILITKSQSWAHYPMLAHTHGQPASPTTLGKEYANFSYRLAQQIAFLKTTKVTGKFNGAVGNYNAHYFAYPQLEWRAICESFVEERLGLTFNPYTTQIEPHDSLCRALT